MDSGNMAPNVKTLAITNQTIAYFSRRNLRRSSSIIAKVKKITMTQKVELSINFPSLLVF